MSRFELGPNDPQQPDESFDDYRARQEACWVELCTRDEDESEED